MKSLHQVYSTYASQLSDSKVLRVSQSVSTGKVRPSLQYFVDTTTTHGPVQIVKSKRGWRIIWLVAMLAAWVIMTVQLGFSAYAFSKYPIKTKVSQSYDPETPFPAITVCNLNPLRKTANETKEVFGGRTIDDLFINLMNKQNHTTICMTDMLKRKIASLIFESPELAEKAGYSQEQIILECKHALNNNCTAKIRKWQHGLYGNCYTLMPEKGHPVPGPEFGTQMLLSVQVGDYEGSYNPSVGLRVEIHPQDLVPFPQDNGFTVAAGNEVNVAVVYEKSERLKAPYGGLDCIDSYTIASKLQKNHTLYAPMKEDLHPDEGEHYDLVYSTLACMKSCFEYNTIMKCNCTDPSTVSRKLVNKLGLKNHITPCDDSDELLRCWFSGDRARENKECEKSCPQACRECMYRTQVTTSDFPDENYVSSTYTSVLKQHSENNTEHGKEFLRTYGISIPPNVTDLWGKKGFMRTPEFTRLLKRNMILLRVYFATFNYVTITDEAESTLTEFLSDMGGTLGLYSGMSFLSLLELVQLVWNLFRSKKGEVASTMDEEQGSFDGSSQA